MKLFKFLLVSVFLFAAPAFSQITVTGSTDTLLQSNKPEPLMILKLSNGEAAATQSMLQKINPDWIETISVFKDSESKEIQSYGKRAENGLVLIYIKKAYESNVKELIQE